MINPTGGGGGLDCEAVFSQWVTDGIEISWSTNPPSAFEIVVLLIGGVDAEATVVFDASSPASIGGTTTHNVGHQVDLCLAAGKSAGREMWQSFGASDGTTNVGILGLSDYATAAGNTRSYTYQDRVFHTMSVGVPPAADTSQSGIALVNFTSSGFDSQTLGIATANSASVLAICTGNASVALSATNTPASTGNESQTFPGHETGLLVVGASLATAFGALTLGHLGLGTSIGVSDQQNSASVQLHDEHGAGTTNCGSGASDALVRLYDDDGTLLADADWNGASGSGYSLTWNTVPGTAIKYWALSVEEMAQLVTPTGISTAEAVGTPAASPGAVIVSPAGTASAEALGTPVVSPGSVSVLPTGVPTAEALGTPSVLAGAVTVSPTGVPTAEAHGTPNVVPGAVTVLPSGVLTAEAFGTPVILPQGVTVLPSSIASAEALGTPALSSVVAILVSAIASAEALGTPAVLAGGVTIVVVAIATGEVIGTLVVSPTIDILPAAIASAEVLGTPAIAQTTNQIVYPSGIGSGEALGMPALFSEGAGHLDLEELEKKQKPRKRQRPQRPPRSIIFLLPIDIGRDDMFDYPTIALPHGPFVKSAR